MAKTFTDYIKDLWVSTTQSKATAASVEEDKKALEELIASQQDVLPDKQELTDTPSYERIEYNALSDDEINDRAKSELSVYENTSKNAIESEIEALDKKYNADKELAAKAAAEKEQTTQEAYETAKEDFSNDSLKRGLARSSIAVNRQADLESAKAGEISKIAQGLSDSITLIDSEISALSVKREKALNDFNIAYASKLTTLINDLKDERSQKSAEALKYNNTLTEKEYSAAVDKTMKESDLYSEALSQKEKEDAMKATAKQNYEPIYSKMREMLAKMTPSEAKKALATDNIYKSNLNQYYYYMLYDEFGRG